MAYYTIQFTKTIRVAKETEEEAIDYAEQVIDDQKWDKTILVNGEEH